MLLPAVLGLSRKFTSVIAKNICAPGVEASPACVISVSASRFKSSAMNSQKYTPASANKVTTKATGIRHVRFGADVAGFLAAFGSNACPQLAQ